MLILNRVSGGIPQALFSKFTTHHHIQHTKSGSAIKRRVKLCLLCNGWSSLHLQNENQVRLELILELILEPTQDPVST